MKKIAVLLADDHTVVRQGLRALLADEEDIEVVGEAENGRQALQLIQKLNPHVAVIDIAMPQLNGLETTRQVMQKKLATKILILSSYSDDEYVHQLTEAGAAGYLIKQTAANDLIKAIRETHMGNAFFSPSISKRLLDYYREAYVKGRPLRRRSEQLTSRELEILQLVAEGGVNKEIASALGISVKTVEKHRQQLMNKLNIHDVAGLTRYALAHGVIEPAVPFGQTEAEGHAQASTLAAEEEEAAAASPEESARSRAPHRSPVDLSVDDGKGDAVDPQSLEPEALGGHP